VARVRAEQLEAAAGTLTAQAAEVARRIVAMALEPSSIAPRDRLNACVRALTLGRDLHTDADIDRRLTALERLIDERKR